MEPYRPLVDNSVRLIMDRSDLHEDELSPETKRILARVLDEDVVLEKGTSTVMNSLHRLAQTFVKSLHEKDNWLEFPKIKQAGNLF